MLKYYSLNMNQIYSISFLLILIISCGEVKKNNIHSDSNKINTVFFSLVDSAYKTQYTDINRAVELAQEADGIADTLRLDSLHIKSKVLLGKLFFKVGLMDIASDYYLKAYYLVDKENIYRKDKIDALIGIGAVRLFLRDYDASENYFKRVQQILENEPIADTKSLSSIYNNLGIIYREKGFYVESYQILEKGINILESTKDHVSNLALLFTNMGNLLYSVKRFEETLIYYNKSLEIYTKENDLFGQENIKGKMAKVLIDQGNVEEAILSLKNSFQVADSIGYLLHQQVVSEELSKIYKEKGDLENYFYYLDFKETLDKKINFENAKQNILLDEIRGNYESRQLELEQKINKLSDLNYFLWLPVLAFLIYFLFIFRRKNKQISLEMIQAKLQNEREALDKQYLQSQIDERDRQITANMIYAIKRNELIQAALDKLLKHRKEFDKAGHETIRGVIHDLKNSKEDHIFEEFEASFVNLHQEFYDNLLQKFPHLTLNEKRLCAFIKLNMTTKEIATVTGQTVPTLNKAKQRVRKKFDLTHSDQDIYDFIGKIV